MSEQHDRLYEQVLLVRAQAGDEAAFAELVERYDRRLRYYLRKLLIDREAAEDALQDVWLDVLRSVARLRQPVAFPAWLYRLARDQAMRRLRRKHLEPLVGEDADAIADESSTVDITAADADQIHAALDRLNAEHREVLL